MIISYYGKIFLNKYNKVEKKNLTPKQFFESVFYPLFYGGDKNLMEITNSPFTNSSNSLNKHIKDNLKLNGFKIEKKWFNGNNKLNWNLIPDDVTNHLNVNLNKYVKKRNEKVYNDFLKNIRNNETYYSIFVGGYAKELNSTTSFNISSDYKHEIDEDEIYYSWIGNALSLQFGGINFLFDNENILYDIYKGWKRYYELLYDPINNKFKGGQISTWNTLWLDDYYSILPSKNFNPFDKRIKTQGDKEKEPYDLKTCSWVRFLFKITKKFKELNRINSYAYKLGQTNETYGNILFELGPVNNFLELCEKYFGKNNFLIKPELYEMVLGTSYNVSTICEFGIIGILALKPKLLKNKEYFLDKKKIKKLNNFDYTLYKLYLMAKINMENMEFFEKVSKNLNIIELKSSNNSQKTIKDFLCSSSLKEAIKNIQKIMEICKKDNLKEQNDFFYQLTSELIDKNNKKNINEIMILININYIYKFKN